MVSVIMPTYNRAFIIKNAINSVLKQTYEDWELIIVDDCSTDNTSEVVQEYMQSDSRIKYIQRERNMGANVCRNCGIKNARGEYIALLDSDNVWDSHKLETQVNLIKCADEDVAVVFCRERIVNGETEFILPVDGFEIENIKNVLCQRNVIDSSTALIKKESFYKVGLFDEALPRWQEWEFFIRLIVIQNYRALFVNEVLNVSYIQSDSISRNSRKFFFSAAEFMKRYPKYFEKNTTFHEIVMREILRNPESTEYALEKMLENPNGWKYMLLHVFELLMNQNNSSSMIREENEILYNWKIKTSINDGQSVLLNYFEKNDSRIAIYGLGKWGELFYQDLHNTSINIVCGIDKKVKEFHELEIRCPGDKIEDVDYIVIAVMSDAENIKHTLEKMYNVKIVLLNDMIRCC